SPLYGSVHKVVKPEKAGEWVSLLLDPPLLRLDGALFALAQLARRTGDRTRDLEDGLRQRTLAALQVGVAPASWQDMVREVVILEAADRARALGDTLPVGLRLA